jgi:uncharacterized protein (TIGR02145 family)/prepilin-type N-terminal cleavage/methylation domain-containing protein
MYNRPSWRARSRHGFTLIELLVVIAIIAILAVVVVLTLNPAELLRQSRDSTRLSALNLYNEDQGGTTGYSLGTPGTIYLSAPDPTATTAGNNCSGLGLPVSSSTYHCAASSTYRKTDGIGWIPVNFASSTMGSPLGSLPVDPTNATSSGEYYQYATDGINFEIVGTPESQKYISQSSSFAVGSSRTLIAIGGGSSFACGSSLVDARDSQSYTTVQIGTQCWMQQNLNVGTEISGVTSQGTSVSSSSSIQKYCYIDATSSCATYGGLYQWTQAVGAGGSAGCDGTGVSQPACTTPIQGVCPANWHIPSHYEWTELELATCTSGTCSTDFPYDETTSGSRGTNEGTTLKYPTGSFRGLLAGYRYIDGSFTGQGSNTQFWSSLVSGVSAWDRALYSGPGTVTRAHSLQTNGFSVRCVHN